MKHEIRQGDRFKDRDGRRYEVEATMGPIGASAGHPRLHVEARILGTREVVTLGPGLFRRPAKLVPVPQRRRTARRSR